MEQNHDFDFLGSLTRALMGLWIFHHLKGGGLTPPPPVTRLLDVVARTQKVQSKAHQKALRKYFRRFFAKVTNEVTRDHKRSNLVEFHISSEMYHYLRRYFS